MNKIFLCFVICLFFAQAYADDVSFKATAPAKVGVGQQFVVQYTLNQKASELKLGNFSDFKLVNGPSVSSSFSTQIINGNMSQSQTYTYSYTFQANSTGQHTIQAAKAKINGKEYSSNPISIEVQTEAVQTAQSARQQRQSSFYDPWEDFFESSNNRGSSKTTNTPKEISKDDIFIRFILNKTNAYKGEAINAIVKIYTRVGLSGITDFKLPDLDGFFSEDVNTGEQVNFQKETYNGEIYDVAEIKEYILYPNRAGEFTINSFELDCQVRQIINPRSFFSSYETVNKKLKSPSVKVNIKNIPKPTSNFSGGIGSFDISLKQSTDTLNINEAVTFSISIKGKGNFNTLESPKINFPKEFEVYDPIISNKLKTLSSGVTGSKTWEYTAIPRYPGKYNLGKINFNYFDLNTNEYKTSSTKEIILAVRKDSNDTNFDKIENKNTQKNIELINDDNIRFLKTKDLNLKKNYFPIIATSHFYSFYIIPFLAFIIIAVILRKKIKENSNIALMRIKNAGKTSRKRLKKAKKLMSENKKEAFYKEIITALWGYCSDRLEIPIAVLTKQKVVSKMQEKKLDNNTITALTDLIDKCEYIHFAPKSEQEALDLIYKDAVNIIEELEQKIKLS